MPAPPDQLDFSFPEGEQPASSRPTGYDRWQSERQEALRLAAHKLGLPLGHRAEVRLKDGTILVGDLRLAEDTLWIEARRDFHLTLRVDRCTFSAEDIEACVRIG